MTQCAQCGNDYHRPMEITLGGKTHVFDSFECAIEALAPRCAQCGVRVLGHGLEAGETVYCCGHCAEQAGVSARA